MKCAIIINAYLKPKNTVLQAERLKSEFISLGVACDIIHHGYLNIDCFKGYDFAVYLDKDKYLSKILENSGLRLFNSHDAIRVCDDKGETYIALKQNGIVFPKTIFAPLCYDRNEIVVESDADSIIERLGLPVVIKESYGSMGKGVYKADNREELLALMQKLIFSPHIYQEYLGKKYGEDIRVIVIGGKVVSAMLRHNDNDFRSNIALGGKGSKITLTKEYNDIAEKVSRALKLDYCGVDLLVGNDNEPVVCEVNSNAFFEEMERISNKNIAKMYCEYMIKSVKESKDEKNK